MGGARQLRSGLVSTAKARSCEVGQQRRVKARQGVGMVRQQRSGMDGMGLVPLVGWAMAATARIGAERQVKGGRAALAVNGKALRGRNDGAAEARLGSAWCVRVGRGMERQQRLGLEWQGEARCCEDRHGSTGGVRRCGERRP